MTSTFELKGWHVLGIFCLAFGTIIAVNLLLAFSAVRTFPGLEVPNSYVASQTFETRAAAQRALGWQVELRYIPGQLDVALMGADGVPATLEQMQVRVGRPTHGRDDLHFETDLPLVTEALTLAPGLWRIDVRAATADGITFSSQNEIYVEQP